MRNRFVILAGLLSFGSAFAACPLPPPVQRDIIADGYYDAPPVYSHIDPVKHAAYEAAVEPLEGYLRNVAAMASGHQPECALNWLVAWAEGDGMLGKIEKEQAHYERKWILAGLAQLRESARRSLPRSENHHRRMAAGSGGRRAHTFQPPQG